MFKQYFGVIQYIMRTPSTVPSRGLCEKHCMRLYMSRKHYTSIRQEKKPFFLYPLVLIAGTVNTNLTHAHEQTLSFVVYIHCTLIPLHHIHAIAMASIMANSVTIDGYKCGIRRMTTV